MRIACPACAASYEVPDRLLAGPARTLRCSRCGADFALPRAEAPAPAAPPLVEAAPPPPPAVEPDPPAAVAPEPPPPPAPRSEPLAAPRPAEAQAPSPLLLRAWVASIAVVLAAIVALLVFHGAVMDAWPASRRLFAALGLA